MCMRMCEKQLLSSGVTKHDENIPQYFDSFKAIKNIRTNNSKLIFFTLDDRMYAKTNENK